ncbi:MAG TPA: hypothetical protein VJ654_03285 [Noviherbaspirillum sp.]|nr:hypothetical protein [Noviherbaspirillum sp.]
MSNSYNNHLGNTQLRAAGNGDQAPADPSKVTGESADLLAWAMAQGVALSKVKIFSTMAKSINDQQ